MPEDLDKPLLEATVGTSTKEDAREAGREVAKNTLNKMNGDPDFFLLFSTGDYKDHGGLQEFLNGVWEVLPEGTPLVGGTIPGFLNPDGCYLKGATALAVSYPNMDVVVGLGKNTKRSPKKAAKKCAKMIKNGLKNRHNNKFLITLISGPEMPTGKSSSIINSRIVARIMPAMLLILQKIFQMGFGKEETILEELTKELPDFALIHASLIEAKGGTNYQFLNKRLLTESALALGIETDLDFKLNFAHGAEKTDIEFKITKINKDRNMIKKINNKPAFKEFIRLMNWSDEQLDTDRWVSITSKNPLGFYKNGKIFLRPVLMVMGCVMGCLGKIGNENMFVAQLTPSKMIQSIDKVLTCNNPKFGFFVSCLARQSFLGIHIYDSQKKLKQYFKNKPFLLIYSSSEAIYRPSEGLDFLNETITSALF